MTLPFSEVEQKAFGFLGLTPHQFYFEWSWPQYYNALKGERAKFERDNLLTRSLLTLMMNVNRDPKRSPRGFRASEIFPFHSDLQEKVKVKAEGMDKDTVKRIIERHNRAGANLRL